MFRRISLVLAFLGVCSISASLPVNALTQAEITARKQERTKIPAPHVGRVIVEAFELYNQGNKQGAMTLLLAIKSHDRYDRAYLDKFIGNLYATIEGKEEEALKWLHSAAEPDVLNYKEQAEVIQLIAQLYMMRRQFRQAIQWYQKWMKFTRQEDSKIYSRIASCYYELGQLGNILYPANKAIELSQGKDEVAYSLKLAAYYDSKDYRHAAKVSEEISIVYPDDLANWVTLAMIYVSLEENQKALDTFAIAKQKGAFDKPHIYITYAKLHSMVGKSQQCIELMNGWLGEKKIDESKATWNVLGFCHEKLELYTKAANYYHQAAQVSGEASYLINSGKMWLKAERYEKAIKTFQNAVDKLVEGPEEAYIHLADAYIHQKNWKKAQKYLQLAEKDKNLADEVSRLRTKMTAAKG